MSEFIVKQLAVGGFDNNFSYVINAGSNGDTAIVDPCGNIDTILHALKTLKKCVPRYILITHGHRDHISGLDDVKCKFHAPVAAHPDCRVNPDISLTDGLRLAFGGSFIECIHSPGHTADSVLYRLSDDTALFTGDTLFVDCCGYCRAETMFHTMRKVIFPLADSNVVYSGHDYGREPHSLLEVEKKRNPYLVADSMEKFKLALQML